jgi:hypothetical protein
MISLYNIIFYFAIIVVEITGLLGLYPIIILIFKISFQQI